MTKQYFEAHITLLGDPKVLEPLVKETKWRFSCIDGDINLGDGIKCYATRQFPLRLQEDGVLGTLYKTAEELTKRGAQVIRRKVEKVLSDDRSSKVRCEGACFECFAD